LADSFFRKGSWRLGPSIESRFELSNNPSPDCTGFGSFAGAGAVAVTNSSRMSGGRIFRLRIRDTAKFGSSLRDSGRFLRPDL
jgi:hypothetical protein